VNYYNSARLFMVDEWLRHNLNLNGIFFTRLIYPQNDHAWVNLG